MSASGAGQREIAHNDIVIDQLIQQASNRQGQQAHLHRIIGLLFGRLLLSLLSIVFWLMTGYFSNHSQSRFLQNQNTSNNNNNTSSPASTSANMSSTLNSQTDSARTRVPSSRHFSTSVSTSSSGDEKPSTKEKSGGATVNGLDPETLHPLRNTYV